MNTLKSVILLAALSALLIWIGGMIGGQNGAFIALGIALVMNFASYWWSDKIVLSMYRGKEVKYEDAPELYGDVQELAQNAGLPMPKVYIVPEQAPNAFATISHRPTPGSSCRLRNDSPTQITPSTMC